MRKSLADKGMRPFAGNDAMSSCFSGGWRGGRPRTLIVHELQMRGANADQIAGAKLLLRDAMAVDERTTRTFAIGEDIVFARRFDLAMDARHVRVDELRVRRAAAAQVHIVAAERKHPPLVRPRHDHQVFGHNCPALYAACGLAKRPFRQHVSTQTTILLLPKRCAFRQGQYPCHHPMATKKS